MNEIDAEGEARSSLSSAACDDAWAATDRSEASRDQTELRLFRDGERRGSCAVTNL